MKTFYSRDAIRRAKRRAIDNIKALRGMPPYDTWSNISFGDTIFAASIKRDFECDDIDEIWKWANS